MDVDEDVLVAMYRTMVRIRAFEDQVARAYAEGMMPGLAHLYTGQEAVAAGVCAALAPDDYITSTHRGHGHCIAKGGDLRLMMAEVFGRRDGYCRGKGGSMHIADPALGILGANGIVGGGLGIAVGAALASRMQGSGRVVAAFFGDDGSNTGMFHECLNMAGVWRLPVVFVCENNLYGISVHQSRHQPIGDVAERAASYGFPGVVVDGNDVVAVHEEARRAIQRARDGGGPTLLECKTYRWRGHHEGDPGRGSLYRPREEIDAWRQRCPIARLRRRLVKEGRLTDEEAARIDAEAGSEAEAAVAFASESAWPEPEEALEDVEGETARG